MSLESYLFCIEVECLCSMLTCSSPLRHVFVLHHPRMTTFSSFVVNDHQHHSFYTLTFPPRLCPHSVDIMSKSKSPTLTLEIPFILLGRRDTQILDPFLLAPHERATKPITLILQTLQHFCPTIPIHPWALSTFSWQTPDPNTLTSCQKTALTAAQLQTRKAEEDKWPSQATGWILRPAPQDTVFLSSTGLRDYRHADAQLTDAEAARLAGNAWHCPVLLQRFDIPTDASTPAWTGFVLEAQKLFAALQGAFADFEGPLNGVRGSAKYWGVVVGERCFLRAVVGGVGEKVGKRVVMLMAAFERELDLLGDTVQVVRFVGVGRWAEWMLMRLLRGERRVAWRSLEGGRDGGEEAGLRSSICAEEERYRRTKGRDREWWDVLHGLSETHLIEGMHTFQSDGTTRLGIELQRTTATPATHQITIQGHRSTLSAAHLIAYTELLALIIHTAHTHTTDSLFEALEAHQLNQPTSPTTGFKDMLNFLSQDKKIPMSRSSKRTLTAYIAATNSASEHDDVGPRPRRPREGADPFHGLRMYLQARHEEERKDMRVFMERYESAGGYRATGYERLSGMLRVEEERRKKKL